MTDDGFARLAAAVIERAWDDARGVCAFADANPRLCRLDAREFIMGDGIEFWSALLDTDVVVDAMRERLTELMKDKECERILDERDALLHARWQRKSYSVEKRERLRAADAAQMQLLGGAA